MEVTILMATGSGSRSLSISDGSIDAERATTKRVLAITANATVNAMMRFVDILPIELQIKFQRNGVINMRKESSYSMLLCDFCMCSIAIGNVCVDACATDICGMFQLNGTECVWAIRFGALCTNASALCVANCFDAPSVRCGVCERHYLAFASLNWVW